MSAAIGEASEAPYLAFGAQGQDYRALEVGGT
jgi:hypothetical protein